ncbi:hypothetical protein [Actinomycetospora sp.]|uniref:hypothetical protein n=1 Tax=Actinomycetospora sp. TaxID=1872135 RepID=UPI002F42EB57
MSSWVMAVEVTPSELVAVDVDRATGGGTLRARRVPLAIEVDGAAAADPVDVLADAFARVVEASPGPSRDGALEERPARLVIATPPDTERRRFEEIAEATALVGLPAPAWLPAPVALVGDRISAEVEVGGQSVVLDTRDGGLTAWPVRRTASGAEIGSRGPVATGTRLDQLLLGVVRAQLSSLDPDAAAGDGPSPGSRTPGVARDLRGEAARLRREIRRARTQLASGEVEEARVAAEDLEVVLERAVFDQLVEHALRETLGEITDGPDELREPVVHVLGDRATPLARRLADLVAGPDRASGALVLPDTSHDGVLGLAALLVPARPRAARAASGAQAIRAARTVGSPPTPVGAPAVGVGGGPGGPGAGGAGDGLGPDVGPSTPEDGLPLLEGHAGDHPDAAIPAARLPSTPVQAQRRGPVAPDDHEPGPAAANGHHDAAPDPRAADHLVLAGAVPHEARPATDTPPGGRAPAGASGATGSVAGASGATGNAAGASGATGSVAARPESYPDASPRPSDGEPSRSAVRGRRGPDTAPQPVPEADPRAGRAPRGAVPLLAVLVVLAVLAAVGVLLVGPDQIGTAFAGLGAGTGLLPLDLWTLSR